MKILHKRKLFCKHTLRFIAFMIKSEYGRLQKIVEKEEKEILRHKDNGRKH